MRLDYNYLINVRADVSDAPVDVSFTMERSKLAELIDLLGQLDEEVAYMLEPERDALHDLIRTLYLRLRLADGRGGSA